MKGSREEIIAGVAIAHLHEMEMGPVGCGMADRRLGLPSGTVASQLAASPYWEVHPYWGAGTYQPKPGLFSRGFDTAGARVARDIAYQFSSDQLEEWSATNTAWLRKRCLAAAKHGLAIIPELGG